MSAFVAADVSAINKAGPAALETSGYITTLQTNMASGNNISANEAMEAFAILCKESAEWVEPYLLTSLPMILDNLATPKTREAATHAGVALMKKMNAHSMKIALDLLYESLESMKWQTKVGMLLFLLTFNLSFNIVSFLSTFF